MSRGLQIVNHSNQVAVWSERVAACRGSGQTVAQWCKAEGIAVSTYYGWQRKLFHQLSTDACFVEVPVPKPSSTKAVATLQMGSIHIELCNDASAELIHNLVEALKSC